MIASVRVLCLFVVVCATWLSAVHVFTRSPMGCSCLNRASALLPAWAVFAVYLFVVVGVCGGAVLALVDVVARGDA